MAEEGRAIHSNDDINDKKEGEIDKDIGIPFDPMKSLPFEKQPGREKRDEDQLN